MDIHPWPEIQELLPPLSQHEKEQLKNSIAQDGVKIDILVMEDGRIIEGHHRWTICQKLGIDIPYKIEHCTEGDGFVLGIELNTKRRHMSLEQKKEVTDKLRNLALSQDQIARILGVSQQTVSNLELGNNTNSGNVSNPRDRRIKIPKSEHGDIYDRCQAGKSYITIAADYKCTTKRIRQIEKKEQKERDRQAEQQALIESGQSILLPDDFRVICGDFSDPDFDTWQLYENSIDIIITDPPYPKEYLHLYEHLAKNAAYLLKPYGLLLAMCGQSYLPDIFELMIPHLTYRWTISYLTPGGQSPQIWPRRINTFWKPVLVFAKGSLDGEDWHGDVVSSEINDNDKRFHEWGQSESGIAKLVEDYTAQGDLILDPFCGGGTTGVICANLERRFIGIDIDPEKVELTKGRILGQKTDDIL